MIELCMSNYEFANSSLFYSDCVLKNVIFKFFLQKKTYDEQKFDSKKTDGPVSSDLKSVKGSPRVSIHAENSLKSGKNNTLCILSYSTLSTGLVIMKN